MFRSDRQISQCCMILTAWIPGQWWTLDGPSKAACNRVRVGVLSSGERAMIGVCFGLWNGGIGRKPTSFADLMRLDGSKLRMVGALLVAIGSGPNAIDLWIDQYAEQAEKTRAQS